MVPKKIQNANFFGSMLNGLFGSRCSITRLFSIALYILSNKKESCTTGKYNFGGGFIVLIFHQRNSLRKENATCQRGRPSGYNPGNSRGHGKQSCRDEE